MYVWIKSVVMAMFEKVLEFGEVEESDFELGSWKPIRTFGVSVRGLMNLTVGVNTHVAVDAVDLGAHVESSWSLGLNLRNRWQVGQES